MTLMLRTDEQEEHAFPYAYITHATLVSGEPATEQISEVGILPSESESLYGLLAVEGGGRARHLVPYGYVRHILHKDDALSVYAAGWRLCVAGSQLLKVMPQLAAHSIQRIAPHREPISGSETPYITQVTCELEDEAPPGASRRPVSLKTPMPGPTLEVFCADWRAVLYAKPNVLYRLFYALAYKELRHVVRFASTSVDEDAGAEVVEHLEVRRIERG